VSQGRYGPPLLPPRPATDLEQDFWDHCSRRQLFFQRCDECERWRHPPRHMCAGCGSLAWSWIESGGRGRVYSWSLTHRPPHPSLAEAVPYASVIVELGEGIRLLSVVRDVAPEDLRLDLPVRVDFEEVKEGVVLPVFLASDAAEP
jgi:uncharacterized OB-fold protein